MSRLKPFLSSILLHAIAFGLLVVSLSLTPTPIRHAPGNEEVIDAVTVNSDQIQEEIERIREIETQQQQELEQQLNELEQQSEAVEQRRQSEERRLAEIREQQQAEEQRRKEAEQIRLEEQRLAEEERKRREAEEQRRKEAEQKRLEEQRLAEEAERKRQEELRRAEEERRQREAEEALRQQQLAEEQRRQQQAAQDRQDMQVINSYVGRIADAIEQRFNTTGLPPGMSCILQIRMIPGGDVVEARIDKTSGSEVFDSRAINAVEGASPLPVPDNPRIFDKMRVIRLTFAPN